MPVLRVAPVACVVLIVGLAACGPTRAQLERDNPVRPNAAPPFGMEEFFKDVPHQPVPTRVRLGTLALLRHAPLRGWHARVRELSSSGVRVLGADCGVDRHRWAPKARARRRASSTSPRERCCPTCPKTRADVLLGRPRRRASSTRCWCRSPIATRWASIISRWSIASRRWRATRPYFREAFGTDGITQERVAIALVRLRAHAHERQRAVRSMELCRRRRTRSRSRPSAAVRCFSSPPAARPVTPASTSPTAAFTISASGGMPRRGTFKDEGRFAVSHDQRDLGAFKTPGCGTSPNIRLTCTTDRWPRFATWSSSTSDASVPNLHRPDGRSDPADRA